MKTCYNCGRASTPYCINCAPDYQNWASSENGAYVKNSVGKAYDPNAEMVEVAPEVSEDRGRYSGLSPAAADAFLDAMSDAPLSRTILPNDKDERKGVPMATGLLDYFPLALAAVAALSKIGNEQHNPGQPLHWAREKSADHPDCIVRHLVDRGTFDTDGVRHSAKVAWRALAMLQLEIEASQTKDK